MTTSFVRDIELELELLNFTAGFSDTDLWPPALAILHFVNDLACDINRVTIIIILNVDLSENQWTQASLPVGVPVWCLLFLVNICLLISYSVRKVLEFSPLSRTWKVLEISVGSGKFWKFDVIVLQSSWICCVSNWIICITLCMCSVKELLNVLMKWCILVSPAFHTVSYYIRVTSKDIMHHC